MAYVRCCYYMISLIMFFKLCDLLTELVTLADNGGVEF